jgi:DNA-directed RNA polymerase specialized sigma24 family protein
LGSALNKPITLRVGTGMSADARRLAAIERLYRDRFSRFLRVARAITGDDEQALDAVQDGFAGAIRSRRSLSRDAALEA